MNRASVIRRATTWTLTFVMSAFGFTGVVSAQTITNTGQNSTNTISSTTTNTCTVQNTNNVSAHNSNTQIGVSGDATEDGNTGTVSWTGWSALNPATAQANGMSYEAWNNQVTDWIGQHAGGANWSGSQDNLSWMPNATDWDSWNPMDWQANNQSFGNWYNGVESYLDSSSTAWLLGWPADATGNGQGGNVTSGSVSNSNSSNFTIRINNAARTAAGTNACGQSAFTPPPVGGKGGGPVSGPTSYAMGGSGGYTPTYHSGGYGGSSSYYAAPHTQNSTPAPAPAIPAVVSAAPATSTTPCAPSTPPVDPAVSAATISNTGQNSTNTISSTTTTTTTVTNTNNVSFGNANYQYASSGDSSASGNTTAGNVGSGAAANSNGTGMDAGLSS